MNHMGPTIEATMKAKAKAVRGIFLPVSQPRSLGRRPTPYEITKQFIVHEVIAVNRHRSSPFPAQTIIHQAARKHSVTVAEMKGAGRYRNIVRARQEAMYRIRMELGYSFPQIAKMLNRSDHTTVMHGFKAHKKRLEAV